MKSSVSYLRSDTSVDDGVKTLLFLHLHFECVTCNCHLASLNIQYISLNGNNGLIVCFWRYLSSYNKVSVYIRKDWNAIIAKCHHHNNQQSNDELNIDLSTFKIPH